MIKITLKIDGMICGMCEAHVNDSVRQNFNVKKVKSSHSKGETVIISETDITDVQLSPVFEKLGYTLISSARESYEKKGLFSAFRK